MTILRTSLLGNRPLNKLIVNPDELSSATLASPASNGSPSAVAANSALPSAKSEPRKRQLG